MKEVCVILLNFVRTCRRCVFFNLSICAQSEWRKLNDFCTFAFLRLVLSLPEQLAFRHYLLGAAEY